MDNNTEEYTALLYFHGIGLPNRYEGISRLSDGLSNYAMSSDSGSVGELRSFKTSSEPVRSAEKETVSYLSFNRFVKYKNNWRKRPENYRMYEGFWSPTTAGGMPPLAVMYWFLTHLIEIFKLPFRSWRESRRLKIISLFKLSEIVSTKKEKSFCSELAEHYRHFDKRDARQKYSNGKFTDFQQFIKTKYNDSQFEFANAIIKRWLSVYRKDIVKLIILYALTAVSPVVFLVFAIIISDHYYMDSYGLLKFATPTIMIILSVGLLKFYKTYIADIFFWVNQQEKSPAFEKKMAILEEAKTILRHVLSDDNCKKVVVVAHSLGTSIAFESLIDIGKRPDFRIHKNDGSEELIDLNLSKLSHFITLGSPIDRIASIFEAARTDYHRYNDFLDFTKGNVTHEPFSIKNSRNINWINFWDDMDPISSSVYSKQYRILDFDEICNERVENSSSLNLVKRHTGYLENMVIMKWIFENFVLKR